MTNVTQLDLFTISFFQGGEISKDLQVEFLDNLLSTYQELETSLMREVYELHKAFRFRTLWEGTNPLSLYQRVAVESAHGVGRLNGILEITNVLRNIEQTETKAVKCCTNNVYTTDIQKWSFDKTRNNGVNISSSYSFYI